MSLAYEHTTHPLTHSPSLLGTSSETSSGTSSETSLRARNAQRLPACIAGKLSLAPTSFTLTPPSCVGSLTSAHRGGRLCVQATRAHHNDQGAEAASTALSVVRPQRRRQGEREREICCSLLSATLNILPSSGILERRDFSPPLPHPLCLLTPFLPFTSRVPSD